MLLFPRFATATLPLSRENNVNSHARIARFNRLSQFSFRRLRYPFPPIDYEFIKVPSRLNRSVAPEGNLVVNALETKKGEGKIKRKKKSGRDDEFFLSAITDTRVKREWSV